MVLFDRKSPPEETTVMKAARKSNWPRRAWRRRDGGRKRKLSRVRCFLVGRHTSWTPVPSWFRNTSKGQCWSTTENSTSGCGLFWLPTLNSSSSDRVTFEQPVRSIPQELSTTLSFILPTTPSKSMHPHMASLRKPTNYLLTPSKGRFLNKRSLVYGEGSRNLHTWPSAPWRRK